MQALSPLCIYLKLSCSCSLYLLLIIFSYVFVHSIQLIICIKHYWYTMNKIPEIMITVNATQPQMIYSIPCCLHKIWIFFCCHTHPFLLHRCNLGIKIPPILWLVAVNCLYIVWRNYLRWKNSYDPHADGNDRGKPERCRRSVRLPNSFSILYISS